MWLIITEIMLMNHKIKGKKEKTTKKTAHCIYKFILSIKGLVSSIIVLNFAKTVNNSVSMNTKKSISNI